MGSDKLKTILLTGATGFLGSHLCRSLHAAGHTVIILKRSFSDIWRIADILDKVKCYDVDCVKLEKAFKENSIDSILHTATSYGRKGESLSTIAATNLFFPLKLMELALAYNADAFVNTDTVAAGSLNPYALSKKQFSMWLEHFSDRMKVINVRLEHMYGPGDDVSKFITYLIKNMFHNKPLDLTPGEQKRDFVFIDDVVSAYVTLLECVKGLPKKFHEFDVGSGCPIKIRKIVEMTQGIIQSQSKINFGAIPYRPNEIMASASDIEPIKSLGWTPHTSLREGLMKTIEYERNSFEKSR